MFFSRKHFRFWRTLLWTTRIKVLGLVILLMLFRKYGWTKYLFENPIYRALNSILNLDTFASKGSRRHHSDILKEINQSEDKLTEIDTNKFWDFSRNADLDGFSSARIYRSLFDQSVNMVSDLGGQTDDAKGMLNKFQDDVKDLRKLWGTSLQIDPVDFCTEEELINYKNRQIELDNEMSRRQDLGEKFEKIYAVAVELKKNFNSAENSYMNNFSKLIAETRRSLNFISEILMNENFEAKKQFIGEHQNLILYNIDQLYKIFDDHYSKFEYQPLTGNFSGFPLAVEEKSISPIKKYHPAGGNELFAENGEILHPFIKQEEKTGLLLVKPGAKIFKNGKATSISEKMFLHPQTYQALPVKDNLFYDASCGRFVVSADISIAAFDSDARFIPYIPYPMDAPDSPKKLVYSGVENIKKISFGQKMVDKNTGLAVPILGITMNPTTGQIIPLGGTVESEITGLKTAIEKYIILPETPTEYRMVKSIKFDENGLVVPDYFENIMINSSGEFVKNEEKFDIHLNSKNGSYENFIRSTMSACDVRLLDIIEEFSEHLNDSVQLGQHSKIYFQHK